MPEESQTPAPSLRLKPRLSPPSGEVPPAMPAPVATADAAPPAAEGMKFRLKPKVSLAPGAPTVSPETLSALRDPDATIPPAPRPAGFTPPKPVAIPPAVAPVFAAPPPPAAPAAPKPAAVDPVALSPAAPKPPTPSRSPIPGYTAPPFPKGSKTKSPFRVPHLKASVDAPVSALEPEPAKAPPRRGGLIAALVSLAVFGTGGYFAWRHFKAPPPAALPPGTAPAQPGATAPGQPAAGPTPSDTLNKLAAMPGNAIQKAQDAIAARRASGQGRVDALAAGDEPPAKKALPEPKSGTATALTQIAPNLAATTELEAAAQASPAFVAWSVNIKVNGVFQGTPARAMINGRLTRTGETVEPLLGIVFDSVDADRKLLIFRDTTGAKVTRKY